MKNSVLLAFLVLFSFIAMALPVGAIQYGPVFERSYCQNGNMVKVYRNPDRTVFSMTFNCGACHYCQQQNWNQATCEPAQRQASDSRQTQAISTQKNETWLFSRRYCMNGKLFTEYKSNLGHYNSIGSPCKSTETCWQASATDAKCVPKPADEETVASGSRTYRATVSTAPATNFSSTPLNTAGSRAWHFNRKYCLPSDTRAFYAEYKSNKGETNVQRFACNAGYSCGSLPSGEIGCVRNKG